jgi:neutral ceramidase
MNAGFAQLEVTPDPGEEMTGYGYFLNRRATGALDPLQARALALEEGDGRAVIVQLDLLGLSREYVAAIRTAVEQATGLPPEHLLLHCTHTHSGPGTMRVDGCGLPSEHYMRLLHGRILQVVQAALDDLLPVTASQRFETDWPEGFASNRVGATDLDTRVRGLRLDPAGGRPIVVLSYACHPVTLGRNREYSADYPGAVLRELNAYGMRALYLNGCCGDIDPLANTVQWGAGTRETLLIYGRDLAARAKQAMASPMTWQTGPVRGCSRSIELDVEPTTEGELRASLGELKRQLLEQPENGPLRVDALWHERMIQGHQNGRMAELAAAEIQAIACGEVVFVGLSAETFTELGGMVRASAPAHHLMVAATSNGVLGYIGTERDIREQGYASLAASKIYGMPLPRPGAGERWAAAGAEVIAAVTGEKPGA